MRNVFKSLTIFFILSFRPLYGQVSGLYYFDIPIINKDTWTFLSALNEKVDSMAVIGYSVHASDFSIQLTYEELKILKKENPPLTKSVRLTLEAEEDLRTFHILGFSLNSHLKKWDAFDTYNYFRVDSFITEPLYIMPLIYYKEFLKPSELEKLGKIMQNIISDFFTPKGDYRGPKPIYSFYFNFEDSPNFKYLEKIGLGDLPANSTIDCYRAPFQDSQRINYDDRRKYTSCADTVFVIVDEKTQPEIITYKNRLVGIEYAIDFEMVADTTTVFYGTSAYKLMLKNNFLGLHFSEECYPNMQTLWIKKNELFNELNNTTFVNGIEYLFSNEVLRRLK